MISTFMKNTLASIGVGTLLLAIGGAASFTYDVVGRLAAIEATQKLILDLLMKR